MSVTVGHVLGIYKWRLEMQRRGVTNPPESVKKFCEDLVRELEVLERVTHFCRFHR
jgi:hypothetical protein